MDEPRPYVARNGNRFTAAQAKVTTELLQYAPEADTRIEWTGNIQVHHPVRPVKP